MNRNFILMAFCISTLILNLNAKDIPIAENGQAKACIVIPEKSTAIVSFASAELAKYLKKITGATFKVGIKPEPGCCSIIRLGMGNTDGFKFDTYAINAKDNVIEIYGRDSMDKSINLFNLYFDNPWKGTLTGVYRFLDRLGVRWYAPGDLHEFVPRKPSLSFAEGFIKDAPFFADRKITSVWNFTKQFPDAKEYGCEKSLDAVYLWGIRNGTSTRSMVEGSHSEAHLRLWENREWLKHPERHQLMKNGKRNPRYSCWTDPGTISLWQNAADAYFSGKKPQEIGLNLKPYLHSKWPYPFISPDEFMVNGMDNSSGNDGRCWCERCQAFRKKYPCKDDSEILWRAESLIANYIAEKHPGKYISTISYGIKKYLPKYTKMPRNIRLRHCASGPKEIGCPNRLADEIRTVSQLSKIFGRENLPLWTYQCICFGRLAPGVPDTYPGLTFQYIQKVLRPYTAGMFLENQSLTHTLRNLDSYLFFRGMWNPNMNYKRERADFFTNYYGPAGMVLDPLFADLEKKWCKFWKLATGDRVGKTSQVIDEMMTSNDQSFGASDTRTSLQKMAWSKVYTAEYMSILDKELVKAEKLAAGDSVYAMRVGLLRKWFFDVMKSERSAVMDREDLRSKIILKVFSCEIAEDSFPEGTKWNRIPVEKLKSAERMNPIIPEATSFRALASSQNMFIKAVMNDSPSALSATDLKRCPGNSEIWKDNCIELFFFAQKSRRFWQIIINDHGIWSSMTTTPQKPIPMWIQYPGLKVSVQRGNHGWTANVTIPLEPIEIQGGMLRFNMTREHNLKKSKPVFSTWSQLGLLGNWHNPDCYGTVVFEVDNP